MAPLRNDSTAELVAEAPAASVTSRDSLRRRISVDIIDLANITDLDLNNSFKVESFQQALSSSFQELACRVGELANNLNIPSNDNNKPATLLASQGSLSSLMDSMMEECRLLIENIGMKDCETTTAAMITPRRASLAQLRTLRYLDTIQKALDCPFQKTVDAELDLFRKTLNLQNQSEGTSKQEEIYACVRISPWTIPSLAFDIDLGTPGQHNIKPNHMTDLPLNVEVRPIIEISAEEIGNNNGLVSMKEICAFDVYIEKCSHEACSYATGAGVYGDASVRVRLSPVGKTKSPKPKIWKNGDVKQYARIKEARCTQANAFPPNRTANVDLFVSRTYGSSDITVMMNFQTFTTMNSQVPDVNMELVVCY